MNARIAVSTLVLAAGFSGTAFAESPLLQNDPFASTRTRAEVVAELHQFKASGVNPWSTSYNPLRQFRSAATREAIVADYIASRDQVRAHTGEDGGSFALHQRALPLGLPSAVAAAQ